MSFHIIFVIKQITTGLNILLISFHLPKQITVTDLSEIGKFIFFVSLFFVFLRERSKKERRRGAEGEGERETQAGCAPSVEPDTGLHLTTLTS